AIVPHPGPTSRRRHCESAAILASGYTLHPPPGNIATHREEFLRLLHPRRRFRVSPPPVEILLRPDAAAPRLSLLAVRSTRATGVSPPMEMTFDCGFTHGGGLGFRRHLWRSPADGVAKAPPSSLSALLGPAARRKSPPLETNLGGNSTDGDDVRLDRRLWRGHLGQR